MTSPRRERTGRRHDFLASERVRSFLQFGFDEWYLDPDVAPAIPPEAGIPFAMDDLRDAWSAIGRELTAQWVETAPGSRPWGWWAFQARERRRCTNGVHPFDNPARQVRVREIAARPDTRASYSDDLHSLTFGVPAVLLSGDFEATFESEADYLTRRDLFLPGERERLAANR